MGLRLSRRYCVNARSWANRLLRLVRMDCSIDQSHTSDGRAPRANGVGSITMGTLWPLAFQFPEKLAIKRPNSAIQNLDPHLLQLGRLLWPALKQRSPGIIDIIVKKLCKSVYKNADANIQTRPWSKLNIPVEKNPIASIRIPQSLLHKKSPGTVPKGALFVVSAI